jgi:protein O-mannosyl-transferase
MNGRLQRVVVAIVLAIAIAAIYLPVCNYGFVVIADISHPKNPGIASGLNSTTVRWIATHVVAGNWYPLTMLSHAVDQQLYTSNNPGGHHLTNVLLHIANTLLLFALLLRILPQPRGWTSNLWPSAIIAALFGLHPLRVESVAWVSERKDVLSGLFFMLTLLAYARYAQARNAQYETPAPQVSAEGSDANASTEPQAPAPRPAPLKWYLLALVMFVLGLLSKPMLVTVPCLFLLLDFWPLNRFTKDTGASARNLVLEKIPFFLFSAIFSVITMYAQKKDDLVVSFAMLPLKARIENAFVSYARYIAKTVWPDSLAAYYPMEKWQAPQVIFAALLVVAISGFALWAARRKPWMFVGWFWFVGLLFPVIGISQVAMQAMADRFTYLPHIGLFMFIIWAVIQLPVQQAKVVLTVFCAAAIALAGVSSRQVRYWQDSETLFKHILAVTPENDITVFYTGIAALEKHNVPEAMHYFERTLQLNPRYSGAYLKLGDIYREAGQFDRAEENYRLAVEAEPTATTCQLKYAWILAKVGKSGDAIEHYRTALRARPDVAEAQYHLGQLLNERHDVAGAIAAFQQAVRVKPDWTDALNDLAWALATQADAKLRNGSQAVEFATRAATLTQRSAPGILDTLGAAYAEAGRFDDAVATMRDAVQRAKALGSGALAAELEGRLKLYQAKQPYRE